MPIGISAPRLRNRMLASCSTTLINVRTDTTRAVTSRSHTAGDRAACTIAGPASTYSEPSPADTSTNVPTAWRRT